MPAISRFYGITIKMYYGDHPPPHFHAEYGGSQQIVSIDTLSVIAGNQRVPGRHDVRHRGAGRRHRPAVAAVAPGAGPRGRTAPRPTTNH